MFKDLESLSEKALHILRLEINNLMVEVNKGKLSASSGRDLVAYVKLLHEMTKLQKGAAEELPTQSEEDLKRLAKELLDK